MNNIEVTREEAIRIVDLWVTREISEEKKDELIEMVLRGGHEAFKRSKILKDINMGREMAEDFVV